MRRMLGLMAGAFLMVMIVLSAAATAQVEIGNINMDWIEWGERQMIVPLENPGRDTARVRINVSTLYTDHYLSGLDLYEKDTILYLVPGPKKIINYSFEIPGSFGRAVTRCFVYWYYPESCTLERCSDSAGQSFSSVFMGSSDAALYSERKYSIGPAFSIVDYPSMNFEFPRLILYLLARGMSVSDIGRVMIVSDDYTNLIRNRMADRGLFPVADNHLAPGIVAINEADGFALKADVKTAGERFAAWYDGRGRGQLDDIMNQAGIDKSISDLPALRMEILLWLLQDFQYDKVSGKLDYDVPQYQNITDDITRHNRPRWVVQGGDYFMPKLCLAAFEKDGRLNLATFTPNPKMPFEKTAILEMMVAVQENPTPIPIVKTGQLTDVIQKAIQQDLIPDIYTELQTIIENSHAKIEYLQPYQHPYLTDYMHRMILGEYFIKHPSAQTGLDCIQVEY